MVEIGDMEIPSIRKSEVDIKDFVVRLVTILEVSYYIDGIYPTKDKLIEKLGCNATDFNKIIAQANNGLKTRGLRPYSDLSAVAESQEVDPYFALATTLLCDITDKRSKAVKFNSAGITSMRFNALLQEPLHKAYYNARVNSIFDSVQESAKLALAKNVESGDLQSIKYYHELNGIFDPNKEVKLNVLKVINVFMEILIRHADKNVIDAVSREFDKSILELG